MDPYTARGSGCWGRESSPCPSPRPCAGDGSAQRHAPRGVARGAQGGPLGSGSPPEVRIGVFGVVLLLACITDSIAALLIGAFLSAAAVAAWRHAKTTYRIFFGTAGGERSV